MMEIEFSVEEKIQMGLGWSMGPPTKVRSMEGLGRL